MHQPDDPGQTIVENHYHGNGVNKLVWGAASIFGVVLLGIGGVALHKLYEQGERLARVETLVEMLVNNK